MLLRLHNGDLHRSLRPLCCSLSLRALSSGAISHSLRKSYRILQLPDDGASDPAEVKEAYLHPDSGAPTADAARKKYWKLISCSGRRRKEKKKGSERSRWRQEHLSTPEKDSSHGFRIFLIEAALKCRVVFHLLDYY